MSTTPNINIANYSVCFIDLLGQKKAMEGQSLLPEHGTKEQYDALIKLIKSSVGKISVIHKHAATMLDAIREPRDPPGPLDEEQLRTWRELHTENTVTQRWSDGLMVFACFGGVPTTTQVRSLYMQFCLAGAMCLVGLAGKAPMRGGIDIAWGVELNPGELYGPAVANAYVLESDCARFPRIVVGEHVGAYLRAAVADPAQDINTATSRIYASICLSTLSRDSQGQLFLDYLSEGFEQAVTSSRIDQLWSSARNFIDEELAVHKSSGDGKLLGRYEALAQYFDSRPPPSKRS